MTSKIKILSAIVLLIAVVLPGLSTQAQVPRASWSEPFRMSTIDLSMTDHTIFADPYGYVHLFWVETLPDNRPIIKYSRFDGVIWTVPIGTHIGLESHTIKSIRPVLTSDGMMQLYWTQGILAKRIVRSEAPLLGALSAQNWAPARPIQDQQAETIGIVVDSQGVFHMVLTRNDGQVNGVFYLKSVDQGANWSIPVWLDPDIPTGYVPGDLTLDIDDADGLHVLWDYASLDLSADFANWVRYAHLLVGDPKWSNFTIDRANLETLDVYELDAAKPVMIVSGQRVVVVWAGGLLHYRHSRFSEDAGRTWSSSTRFMGNLNGQAGDGLAVDGDGRIHFFSQIRSPIGIYHSVFSNNRWTSPALVYFVRLGSEGIGGVHAHRTYPAFRAGNQIVLTFTDPPASPMRGLYVTTSMLSDVEPQVLPVPDILIPSPTAVPTPTPTPPPTLAPAIEAAPQNTAIVPQQIQEGTQEVAEERSEQTLVAGMLFSVLLLIGIAGVRIIIKR